MWFVCLVVPRSLQLLSSRKPPPPHATYASPCSSFVSFFSNACVLSICLVQAGIMLPVVVVLQCEYDLC